MPGAAAADLTNTLGWTVMNYYAPYWVRCDSLQLSNPRGGLDLKSRNLRSEMSRFFNKNQLQGTRQDEISLGLVIWVR